MDKPIVPSRIRKVFEGRVFTVNVESIVLPQGKPLEAEVIRHPGSVVVVPVTDKREIVLVRQYRHPIGRWAWELPAGSLKYGEEPAAAAARECQEETGLVAATLEPLGSYFPTPGYCDEEMHFYRATGLRPPGDGDPVAHQDEDEDIEVRPFSAAEIRTMVQAGELSDLKTIAGLALIGLSLKP